VIATNFYNALLAFISFIVNSKNSGDNKMLATFREFNLLTKTNILPPCVMSAYYIFLKILIKNFMTNNSFYFNFYEPCPHPLIDFIYFNYFVKMILANTLNLNKHEVHLFFMVSVFYPFKLIFTRSNNFLNLLLTKNRLTTFLSRKQVAASLSIKSSGFISITSKKKYIGVSISFQLFQPNLFEPSKLVNFKNVKELRQAYKLITTISTAIITKLFLLPKSSRLQPIIYLLLGKLTRRYLLLLDIQHLNFTFKNYLENFEYF
jgi:hypothetical protein